MAAFLTSVVAFLVVTSRVTSSHQQQQQFWTEDQFEFFEQGLTQLADQFLPFDATTFDADDDDENVDVGKLDIEVSKIPWTKLNNWFAAGRPYASWSRGCEFESDWELGFFLSLSWLRIAL